MDELGGPWSGYPNALRDLSGLGTLLGTPWASQLLVTPVEMGDVDRAPCVWERRGTISQEAQAISMPVTGGSWEQVARPQHPLEASATLPPDTANPVACCSGWRGPFPFFFPSRNANPCSGASVSIPRSR